MSKPNKFANDNHHLLDMGNKNLEYQMDLVQEEEFECKSTDDGMEVPPGDDQDQRLINKKPCHRHTQHQIQEMEVFYKEYPHPDDKQRDELGRRLSLEPTQVKFWFQNRRIQMKARHERRDNSTLRSENEKMRVEIIRYKEALKNVICPHCGAPPVQDEISSDEQLLSIQNNSLREEIDMMSGIATKYDGKSKVLDSHNPRGASHLLDHENGSHNGLGRDLFGAIDLHKPVFQPTTADKLVILELVVGAMNKLIDMSQAGEPLWTSGNHAHTESLNMDEYVRLFPRRTGPKTPGLISEVSRNSTIVNMNHINIVEILMDVNKFSSIFASIIPTAMILKVLSTGVAENYNGALQVMVDEFQVPSPAVPTRENYFVRYCTKHDDETWVVVDVSLDNLRPGSVSRYKRRPSGCLIRKLPNGYSKVTWVEHVEIDDITISNIYKPLVNSGLAFGARRWVATLDRQCEQFASFMANISAGNVEGKASILKLAERMMMSFYSGAGASTAHAWMKIYSGDDNIRIMTQKSMDGRGRPRGIVMSAATSLWLPAPPNRVFDFLCDEKLRSEWDIFSNDSHVHKMTHIANGRDPRNIVSLLCIKRANSSPNNMVILQESSTNLTGSYVVYAPIDIAAMKDVLNGGNPNYVALLPSGFAILPDGPIGEMPGASKVGPGGSLLTVAFQILAESVPTGKLSLDLVATVNTLIKSTVERIKAMVLTERP